MTHSGDGPLNQILRVATTAGPEVTIYASEEAMAGEFGSQVASVDGFFDRDVDEGQVGWYRGCPVFSLYRTGRSLILIGNS